jgi:hypothetical protein
LVVFVRRPLIRLCLLAGVLLACVLCAPAAQAGVLDSVGTSDCQRDVTQPFGPWGDTHPYFLAPNGDFANGADGWRLSGGAVVDENSPVGGGAGALQLADGDSATSPGVCVGLDTPTMRFFARNAGDPDGTLEVDVRFEGPAGLVLTLPIGDVRGGEEWAPSPALPIVVNLLALIGGWRTPVAFRFRADGGTWLIDDVYVDPYGKG